MKKKEIIAVVILLLLIAINYDNFYNYYLMHRDIKLNPSYYSLIERRSTELKNLKILEDVQEFKYNVSEYAENDVVTSMDFAYVRYVYRNDAIYTLDAVIRAADSVIQNESDEEKERTFKILFDRYSKFNEWEMSYVDMLDYNSTKKEVDSCFIDILDKIAKESVTIEDTESMVNKVLTLVD